MMGAFKSFRVTKTDTGFEYGVLVMEQADLPPGDVVIGVHFSSLNYKDGLSATGNPGVTRHFPHTPGIDAAGVVLASESPNWQPGDEVIVTGYDLGMSTAGGFSGCIRVSSEWLVPCPSGLSLREAMVIGTAGFTAAQCVDKLQVAGLGEGEVLVTGATGGVGSMAVRLLAHLGLPVVAVTGKPDKVDWLHKLGATEVISRDALRGNAHKPLLAERWAGVVDTVGGDMLVNAIKGLRYGASAAICGLVNSPELPATVLPFILRHVNLLGIDSVVAPINEKQRIWQKLAEQWKFDYPEQWVTELSLTDIADAISTILAGGMVGRGLVCLSQEDRP